MGVSLINQPFWSIPIYFHGIIVDLPRISKIVMGILLSHYIIYDISFYNRGFHGNPDNPRSLGEKKTNHQNHHEQRSVGELIKPPLAARDFNLGDCTSLVNSSKVIAPSPGKLGWEMSGEPQKLLRVQILRPG